MAENHVFLTSEQLEAIEARAKEGPITPTEATRLLADVEALSERLSEAWILLDQIARTTMPNEVKSTVRIAIPDEFGSVFEAIIVNRRTARAILKRRRVPGWRD